MLTRKIYFVVGTAIVFAALALYVLPSDRTSSSKYTSSNENPTTRTWRDAEIHRVSLEGDPWKHLFNPSGMEVYEDHIYVADKDDSLRIKRFTSDGHLVNTIGAGIGEGPGELKHIADYYVGDGEVWVADSRARNISRFTIDGPFLNRFNVEHHPLRVTSAGNHIAVQRIGPADLFQVFDTTGAVKNTFGQLISNQSKNFMSLTGYLVPGIDNNFIYAPKYASYIYYFDNTGNSESIRRTIDRLDFPKSEMTTSGDTRIFSSPDQDINTLGASVYDNKLYIRVFFSSTDNRDAYSILDVYNRSSGEYIESMRLPKKYSFTHFDISKNHIYATSDTTFRAFEYK